MTKTWIKRLSFFLEWKKSENEAVIDIIVKFEDLN